MALSPPELVEKPRKINDLRGFLFSRPANQLSNMVGRLLSVRAQPSGITVRHKI